MHYPRSYKVEPLFQVHLASVLNCSELDGVDKIIKIRLCNCFVYQHFLLHKYIKILPVFHFPPGTL